MAEPNILEKTYQELMELIFRDKYKLLGVVTHSTKIKEPNLFETFSIYELEKENSKISIKVSDELSFKFAFGHQYFPDELDGKIFIKFESTEKYYEDIDFIAVDFDKKVQQAAKDIIEGKSELAKSTEVDELFEEFIVTPDSVYNQKFIPVKKHYHEIYAKLALEGQQFLTAFNKAKEDHSIVKKYSDLLDTLSTNFIAGKNPMASYRHYKKLVDTSSHRWVEKVRQQNEYIDWLFKGGNAASTPLDIRCLQVLDAYRRAAELVRNPIREIRRIVEFEQKVPISSNQLNFDEDIAIIKNVAKYKEIVTPIDPILRHSESHLFTRFDKEKKIIYIQDEQTKQRFNFDPKTVHERRKEIFVGLITALIAFYALTDIALKLMTLRSKSFLYRIVLVGNTKK